MSIAAWLTASVLTAIALVIAAGASAFAARKGPGRPAFLMLSTVFVFFAVDESVDLHEEFGLWLEARGIPDGGLVRDVDTLILAGYGLVVFAAVASSWRVLAAPRLARLAFAVSAVCGAIALTMDARLSHDHWYSHGEEYAEALAAGALAVASVAHAHVRLPGRGLASPLPPSKHTHRT